MSYRSLIRMGVLKKKNSHTDPYGIFLIFVLKIVNVVKKFI